MTPELLVLGGLAVGLMALYLLTTPAPRRRRPLHVLGWILIGLGIYALHFSAIEAYTAATEPFDALTLAKFWALLSIPLSVLGLVLARRK